VDVQNVQVIGRVSGIDKAANGGNRELGAGSGRGVCRGGKMNAEENLTLMGLKLAVDGLALEIARQRKEAELKSRYENLPEWISLEQAVALKGGGALNTYRQKLFLQPCCGSKYRLVSGRRCWRREDIIEWLNVSDEKLKDYAKRFSVSLPKVYEERGER
jgi:hypothetical protein